MKYEMVVILTGKFNSTDLNVWTFDFGKILKKVNASEISILSRGKRKLKYPIRDKRRGNYVQVNFNILPEYIQQLSMNLNLDINVLRFMIFNKNHKS